MIEIFTGYSRSEQADRFIEKVEAEGGTVYDRWADQDVETGVSYIEVEYDMPEETDEDEEE